MNIPRLREVKAMILAKPQRFDMDDFVERKEGCGTTRCIGGNAAFLAGCIRNPRKNEDPIDDYVVTRKGETVNDSLPWVGAYAWPPIFRMSLDLDVEQSERLFSVDEWPPQFYVAYRQADTCAQRAKIAAERITHFIKTKGKE